MSKTYNQNELTIALASELLDRYYLSQPVILIPLTYSTLLMIASKFDEIDYNLVKV